ncbi:peptide chain release factor 1 [Halalkalibacillus halophilus]|uniref:peptide chain release factor 1 n=1 Tax=Halalkalibacillus halophilus TaxID=392827 RepID=UPI000422110C|nr:peptide chain release factor 1 [Halalkalibacillus halophilus]
MFDKLEHLEERYDQLTDLLMDPEVIGNSNKLREYSKEQADLQPVVEKYRHYKDINAQIAEAKTMLHEESDADMVDMARDELEELQPQVEPLEKEMKMLLIPKDPNDDKNIIMEIRGAAGGDEAALFAGNLYRMYARFAESKNWKIEVIEAHEADMGGYKEIIFMINGANVYSNFKYENGAHRVQRVPETESGGRIHTSTATVAVLPEAEEVEVEIHDKDVRVDTFTSSGPGGQSVNTTMSAVRLTHVPTGVVVSCQDEKSQIKNKEKAMKVLRARVYEMFQKEAQDEYDENRKSAVGTGDRSERIRTYNYPQNRVTDHRIGLTINKLDQIMEGKLEEFIDALLIEEQTQKLEELGE